MWFRAKILENWCYFTCLMHLYICYQRLNFYYLKTPEIYLSWKKWVTDTHSVLLIISRVMAIKFQNKNYAGIITQVKRKGKDYFYVGRSPLTRNWAINVILIILWLNLNPWCFRCFNEDIHFKKLCDPRIM